MSEKTVIVVEEHGMLRHYRADGWQPLASGGLSVTRNNGGDEDAPDVVAVYAPGAWLSVRDSDAEVPDGTARALGVAMGALREILGASKSVTEPFGRPEIRAIAQRGLDEAYDEEQPF